MGSIIGSAIGGIASGLLGGGGGDKVTQTVTNQIPAEFRPLATQIASLSQGALAKAQRLSKRDRPFRSFSIVPDESAISREARLRLSNLGRLGLQRRLGPGLVDEAQQNLRRTLQGDFLFGGPAFQAALADTRRLIPRITSEFAGAGRLNSGLAQTAVSQAAADALARQFGAERQNQLRAAAITPEVSGLDIRDVGLLQQSGLLQEGRKREKLLERAQRFDFNQEDPRQRLDTFLRQLAIAPGLNQFGSVQQTSVPGPSTLQQILGGGLVGLGIARQLGAFGGGIQNLSGGQTFGTGDTLPPFSFDVGTEAVRGLF